MDLTQDQMAANGTTQGRTDRDGRIDREPSNRSLQAANLNRDGDDLRSAQLSQSKQGGPQGRMDADMTRDQARLNAAIADRHSDMRDLRNDRADLRGDRTDLRADRGDARSDMRNVRGDRPEAWGNQGSGSNAVGANASNGGAAQASQSRDTRSATVTHTAHPSLTSTELANNVAAEGKKPPPQVRPEHWWNDWAWW